MVQTAACKYKMLMNLRSKSPVHSDNVKESKKKTYNSNQPQIILGQEALVSIGP